MYFDANSEEDHEYSKIIVLDAISQYNKDKAHENLITLKAGHDMRTDADHFHHHGENRFASNTPHMHVEFPNRLDANEFV